MEPIKHEPEFVQGFEVLNFSQVELEKVREDGAHTFATLGNLSVFYFDYFERFILQINNWRYCLLPKLPTKAASSLGLPGRNFIMPAYDGTYTLKLNQVMSPAALQNFETILAGATRFAQEGAPQEFTLRSAEPVLGEVVQSQIYTAGEPGIFYERPREMTASNFTGSTLSKGNSDVKKSKLKVGLSNFKKKFSKKNKAVKETNLNFTQIRDYQSIRATPATMVTVFDFKRQDIEAAIVSTKEIIRKLEGPPASLKEEIKEKVAGFVDVLKEGVQDIRGKIADRHEHEAKTGEKVGIMEIVKGGVQDMRNKLNKKGPLEDGEIEPLEGPETIAIRRTTVVTETTKPGIVDTVKNEYYELKEKAALRQELSGVPAQKVGILDIVKEGVFEIKEKLAARKAQENAVMTERVETVVTQPGVVETHATRLLVNEPPRIYESRRTPEGRLKIFDDKYLDQPLHTQPFPISGAIGENMVEHFSTEYTRPVVTKIEYKELTPQMGIMDKLKANLPFSENSHHLPVKETHVPVGHASGNISDRIKDMVHGTSNTVAPIEPAHKESKPGIIDKVQMFLGTKEPPEERTHSPVKKREFIKALIKSQPEEAQDQGRLLNIAHAGGIMGIAGAGGVQGLVGVAGPLLMKKKVEPATQNSLLGKSNKKPGMMDKVKNALPFGHTKAQENIQGGSNHEPGAVDKIKSLLMPGGASTDYSKKDLVMEQPTVIVPEYMHTIDVPNSRVYEQPIIERHMPTVLQPSTVKEVYNVQQTSVPVQTTIVEQVQPSTVQEVYQVHQEIVPTQARVIDMRVERVVNPQVQISTPQVESTYESQIAHYEC